MIRACRMGRVPAAALLLGLALLYGPLLLVVAYSFNGSRLVGVWGGFSTRWYGALLANEPLRDAASVSVRVALLSAGIATALGTLAALALDRHRRFAGRTVFTGAVYAPLVMPEVITGLSLLLLFVAIGFERGFWTIVVAHATVTLSFVAVVVGAKLGTLDRSLEEAAADLGAPPLAVFLTVTLPLLAPALLAGFLLAFTMSLDDLVIASFTSGPGATTLPMRIYSGVRLGLTPEVNAASTLLIAVTTLAVGTAALVTRGGAKATAPGRPAAGSPPAGRRARSTAR